MSISVNIDDSQSKRLFLPNTNSKLYRSMKVHSTLLLYLFLILYYVLLNAQGSFKIAIIAHTLYRTNLVINIYYRYILWRKLSSKQREKTIALFVSKEVIKQLNMIYHDMILKDAWEKSFDINCRYVKLLNSLLYLNHEN